MIRAVLMFALGVAICTTAQCEARAAEPPTVGILKAHVGWTNLEVMVKDEGVLVTFVRTSHKQVLCILGSSPESVSAVGTDVMDAFSQALVKLFGIMEAVHAK